MLNFVYYCDDDSEKEAILRIKIEKKIMVNIYGHMEKIKPCMNLYFTLFAINWKLNFYFESIFEKKTDSLRE